MTRFPFPCVGTLWSPASEASALTRRGSTLPMHTHDRPTLDASPAFGEVWPPGDPGCQLPVSLNPSCPQHTLPGG